MSNFREQTDVNRTDIMCLLQKIRENLVQTGNEKINFDRMISDSDLKKLTGLDRCSFQNLLLYLTAVRDTPVRSRRTCLGIFLTKNENRNVQKSVINHIQYFKGFHQKSHIISQKKLDTDLCSV